MAAATAFAAGKRIPVTMSVRRPGGGRGAVLTPERG